MPNKTIIALIAGLFLSSAAAWGADLTPEASLKKNYPHKKIESLQPTPIKGVFEVVTDREFFYYAPEAECIIVGNIITKEGKNISQQRREEIIQRKEVILLGKIKDLPLDKAVKIGTGRHKVIEFTDPNCSYCRKAFQVLSTKEDMTRYIFFFPLSKASEDKVKHILCATDRVGAYKEVFSGQLDKKPLAPCESAAATALMKVHREQAMRLGIEGTPFFIIDGHVVAGADIPMIEKLLGAPVK
ncbi:MAG: DsbC family protein [Syntrophales bacterium]